MQMLAPSLLSSQGVVHSLGVVAYYSDYSSIHSSDCFDYYDCLSMLVICSSPVAYTLSLYVNIHEAFIILSCYLNCGLT